MNGTVEEWISKAEGDYRVASRELNVADSPSFDAVCFHSQQCAEKLIKALIIHRGGIPPKIHDLRKLDRLVKKAGVDLQESPKRLHLLSMSAVLSRYPNDSADREDAVTAFEICSNLRTKLLALLST
jgi:HEPN domain-containing protein